MMQLSNNHLNQTKWKVKNPNKFFIFLISLDVRIDDMLIETNILS